MPIVPIIPFAMRTIPDMEKMFWGKLVQLLSFHMIRTSRPSKEYGTAIFVLIFQHRDKRLNRLSRFFCKSIDRCRAFYFVPLFFWRQIDLLELVKGNIKLNIYPNTLDANRLYKLRRKETSCRIIGSWFL